MPNRLKVDVGHASQFEEPFRGLWLAVPSGGFEVTVVLQTILLYCLCGTRKQGLNSLPFLLIEKRHFALAPPAVVHLGHTDDAQLCMVHFWVVYHAKQAAPIP